MKNIKDNIKKGLSLFQTIVLGLVFVVFVLALGVIYYQNSIKTKQYSQAIVVTEDVRYGDDYEPETQDLIGDFILNHEYFTADAEVLKEEHIDIENQNLPDETVSTQDIEVETENSQNMIVNQDNILIPVEEIENVVSKTEETDKDVSLSEHSVPLIAVVVDDMGINQKRTLDIISLKAPLTSSFLTYGKNLGALAEQAKEAGHEIMIHTPMEPKVDASLAPDTLKTDMSKEEIENAFLQMLQKFEAIEVKGINNHMGSKFTEDKERLGYIIDILKLQNMFFLDSKTTSLSKGKELALDKEVDFASRDIFLDNENNYDYIFSQLLKAEKIAFNKGYAIAICHPKSNTYPALKDWIETLKDKEIKLVHVSQIVQKINQ